MSLYQVVRPLGEYDRGSCSDILSITDRGIGCPRSPNAVEDDFILLKVGDRRSPEPMRSVSFVVIRRESM